MKIFLDDVREAPAGWIRCRTPDEVIALLKTGRVSEVSLDHNLGIGVGESEQTGYSVLVWIEQEVAEGRWSFPLPDMHVHSSNPAGHARMKRAIDAIRRLHER
ncbi:hypothetical protein BH20ACT13_BH20ACT13_15890 [soil metagenome]